MEVSLLLCLVFKLKLSDLKRPFSVKKVLLVFVIIKKIFFINFKSLASEVSGSGVH